MSWMLDLCDLGLLEGVERLYHAGLAGELIPLDKMRNVCNLCQFLVDDIDESVSKFLSAHDGLLLWLLGGFESDTTCRVWMLLVFVPEFSSQDFAAHL